MALRVGSLRRTDSVAIEGIADIGEILLPVGATRMTHYGPGPEAQAHRSGHPPVRARGASSHLDLERFRPAPWTCRHPRGRLKRGKSPIGRSGRRDGRCRLRTITGKWPIALRKLPLGVLHPVLQEHCWRLLWLTWPLLMELASRQLRESSNYKKCRKTLLAMETRPAVYASDGRVRA
jgi:hypothetical protein